MIQQITEILMQKYGNHFGYYDAQQVVNLILLMGVHTRPISGVPEKEFLLEFGEMLKGLDDWDKPNETAQAIIEAAKKIDEPLLINFTETDDE